MHWRILGAAFLAAFFVWSALVHARMLAAFDAAAMALTKSVVAPWLDVLAGVLNYVAAAEVTLALTCATALVLWARGRSPLAAVGPLIWVAGLPIELSMKLLVDQPVPSSDFYRRTLEYALFQWPTMQSYPSGHSLRSAFLALLVIWATRRGHDGFVLGSLAVGVVLVNGWTRAYQGHHWPTDVLGGWLLGVGLGLLGVGLTAQPNAPPSTSAAASASSGT